MKREAQQHPKVTRLARELKVWPVTASGIVANLWLQTATHAHRGDIGRWPNWQIAEAIGYPGDPDELVRALVACRLLDETCEQCGRLYVHDWHDHAEDWVHLRIARNREHFANGSSPSLTRMGSKARAEIEAFYRESKVQVCAHICAHERTNAHICALPLTLDPRPLTLDQENKLETSDRIRSLGHAERESGPPDGEPSARVTDGPVDSNGRVPGAQPRAHQPADPEQPELDLGQAPKAKAGPDPWKSLSPPGFAEFWEAYPRKKKRVDALAAWRKIRPSPEVLAAILDGLARHIRDDRRFREAEFTPYPASWLRQRSWTEPGDAIQGTPAKAPARFGLGNRIDSAMQEFLERSGDEPEAEDDEPIDVVAGGAKWV